MILIVVVVALIVVVVALIVVVVALIVVDIVVTAILTSAHTCVYTQPSVY